jgi:plasmid stability protein
MIQIRHVPDGLHRQLKARAASHGRSLSDYLMGELKRAAERPTREEMLARLAQRAPTKLRTSAAEIIRRERDSR